MGWIIPLSWAPQGIAPPVQRAMPARSWRLLHLHQSLRAQQCLHGLGLVLAVLQQQPAARRQARWRLGHDGANVVQPVGAAGQGVTAARGVSAARCGSALADVGRVDDDGVEHARPPRAASCRA